MPAAIELPDFVTEDLVVHLYRRHKALSDSRTNPNYAYDTERAQRAARIAKHDDKMKLLLEKGAEILHRGVEREFGQTLRDSGTPFSHRVPPTEYTAWSEAYRCAADGKDADELAWLYLVCAEFLGYL